MGQTLLRRPEKEGQGVGEGRIGSLGLAEVNYYIQDG